MKLQWPIAPQPGAQEPAISQGFGQHDLDYSQFGLAGHNGLDMPAPLGTPIHAAADGFIVEQTAKNTGFGLRITQRIEIGGQLYMCIYGHMERLEKNVDMPWNWNDQSYPVKAGDVIGYVDSTGFSTGNHLHFGLYPMDSFGDKTLTNGYGGAIDPLPFFREPMTNSLLIQRGDNEFGFYDPCTADTALISAMRNRGIEPPLNADGTLNWNAVKAMVQGHL